MQRLSRRLVAELLGTFTLVFIGAGAVLTNSFPKGGFGMLGVALAHGPVSDLQGAYEELVRRIYL